uniref:sterile alpha motif domain-containing protein 1-like isoform X2 n=1 Tax=Pristiophorus japonicus TaxID=55135 RepID=UPI00398EB6FF
MAEAECQRWIQDTIESLRSRKARPDLERICKMVQRRHGLAPSRTRRQLERLLRSRTVLRVSYKGSHSYRNAAPPQPGPAPPASGRRSSPQRHSVLTRARLRGVQQQQVARGQGAAERGRRRLPTPGTERKKTRSTKEAAPSEGEGSDEETVAPLKDQDSMRQPSGEARKGVEDAADRVSGDCETEAGPVKLPATRDRPSEGTSEELSTEDRVETSSAVEQSPSRCPSAECKDLIGAEMEVAAEDLKIVRERICPENDGDVGSSEVSIPMEEGCSDQRSQQPCANQGEAESELGAAGRQGPVLCDPGEASRSTERRPLAEYDHMTCHQPDAKTTEDTPLPKDCNRRKADDSLDTMLLGQLPSASPSPKREAVETAAGLSSGPRDSVPEVGGASFLLTPSASPVDMVPEVNGPTDRHILEENGKSVDPTEWSIADVVNYFKEAGFPEQAGAFEDQEIDGKSLLLMKRNDVLTGLAIKLGPALKIYEYHIKCHHWSENEITP